MNGTMRTTSMELTGDTGAFRHELIGMIPALRAFARSLCGRRELADDLTQETLVKAWQARERFQLGTNLKAWLFTILRNEFYSTMRRSKTAAEFMITQALVADGHSAEKHAQLDVADLMRAFSRLNPEQREALTLTTGDLTYVEAARVCGCSVGTIKSRVSRARKRLQDILENGAARLPARGTPSDVLATFFAPAAQATGTTPR